MSKYVNWSMHEVLETIDAYLNSKHISGETDSLGREKPFQNIVVAAANIWFRATDIDRKDIRFVPQTTKSIVLAFVANVLLQRWMDENNFGQWLNDWGRTMARYGSAVSKFVEKGDQLIPSVIPWNRYIPDPIQFNALPNIEKFFKTAGQLTNMATKGHPEYAGYDPIVVSGLITAVSTRKTIDRLNQDNMPYFIEIYEVHGLMDTRLLVDEIPDNEAPADIKYRQQMHVVSYVKSTKGEEYDDFCLYKGPEKTNPYQITHLIEEDGRTLAIGAVEYLFQNQWMVNHGVKNMKDTLDLASRILFQTPDEQFSGRNVLNDVEVGDILIHALNKPVSRIPNQSSDMGSIEQFINMWNSNGMELTGTPEALRGNVGAGAKAYRLAALQVQQAGSLFDLMTENKGLSLEQILILYAIPNIKKKLKNSKEICAILDDAGIKEIDSMYVPRQAIQRYNSRTTGQILDNARELAKGNIPSPLQPFSPQQEQNGVQSDLASLGNKRFLVPDEVDDMTWSELFSDFEWESLKVQITNENVDKQATLAALNSALQLVVARASNPALAQDSTANLILSRILSETGIVSPLEISMSNPPPPPPSPVTPPQSTPSPIETAAPSAAT